MKHSVLVIGLGRFGTAAARELMRLGHEVLAIDTSEARVNDMAPEVTHAMQLDAADDDALRAVGAHEFDHAIVAISSSTEASIFATMALKKLGVRNVIAKAATSLHGSILERVGADRVVYPERDTGTRVAHLFAVPNVIDYLDAAPRFGIVKIRPPESFIGQSIRDLDLQNRLRLTPVALRRGDDVTVNPHRDDRILAGDELILIGLDDRLEALGQ
jgi:trk system potassium uptake protein